MTNLKKSFLIALLTYLCLIVGLFFVFKSVPHTVYKSRVAVDPSLLHIKKSTQKRKKQKNPVKKRVQKALPKKHKKVVKKLFSEKEHFIKPTQKPIIKKEHPQLYKKPKPLKKIDLPQKNKLIESLLNTLPKAKEAQKRPNETEQKLKELYGKHYTTLSSKTKKYLKDNLLIMQSITQETLNRIGRMYLDPRFYYYDYNIVEFVLYPNGNIGEIKLLKDAGFELLDKITKETIETAYKDYPLPSEPTLIRYKFFYDLRSF